ncbi:ribosomal silencing factor RsfS [Actinomycetota bacterium]|nr:ribosomal silencing factor RsfS [Actinomycetota bacterium]
MTKAKQGSPKDWAIIAAQAALEKKAKDVLVQEVKKTLVIVDYFVIASGENNRQITAICDAVEEALLNKANLKPIGREGLEKQDWVLLDYGDFVVHVFLSATRDFYRLDSLYNDAPLITIPE